MNESRYYVARTEGTKYGLGFGSALAIAISYTAQVGRRAPYRRQKFLAEVSMHAIRLIMA